MFLVTSAAAACVRMPLWCAPNSPVLCTIRGAPGAPAQCPVDGAKGLEPVSAGTQRVVLPVPTPSSQRTVTCQHVQVRQGTKIRFLKKLFQIPNKFFVLFFFVFFPSHVSPAGCLLSEWSPWSECSASCGGGLAVRNKTVLQEPEPSGAPCAGPLEQHIVCNTNSCLPGKHKHSFVKFRTSKTSISESASVCFCLQSVPVARCSTSAQEPVPTCAQTCGRTPSVCLLPAHQGARAHLDRFGPPASLCLLELNSIAGFTDLSRLLEGDAQGLMCDPLRLSLLIAVPAARLSKLD